MNLRNVALTLVTLVAFGLNSILCRFALSGNQIDAASFTFVRLLSGAIALAVLSLALKRKSPVGYGTWLSGALLFGYAVLFSFAYLNLTAGTGGLILFGAVQLTMIGTGFARGERPTALEWVGLLVAQVGLIVLVAPGLHAPSPIAALAMAFAGVCWGNYCLRGKLAKDSTLATADNFLRALPFGALIVVMRLGTVHGSANGIALAIISGSVTSGLGYALWYTVLPQLTSTRAAIAQLAVPALVAIMGVVALSEQVSPRFLIASILMLGGVCLAILTKARPGEKARIMPEDATFPRPQEPGLDSP